MKTYHTLLCALVLLLSGCNNPSTFDCDTDDPAPAVAPVQARPVVTHNLLRSSYRIRAHLVFDGENHFVAGTGTAIDPTHILTVAHVVTAAIFRHPDVMADSVVADVFNDDAEFDHSIVCTVIKVSVHEDIALLQIVQLPGHNVLLPFFHNLDYGTYTAGAPVYNIGAADGGIPFQIFHGSFSRKDIEMDALDGEEPHVYLYELSYPVHGGTSGGGVYTYDGKFVGMIDRGDAENTWIVKYDVIKTFLGVK